MQYDYVSKKSQLRNHLPWKSNPILPQARHNPPLKLLGPSPSNSKPRNTSIKPIKNKAYHKARQHKYLHLIGKIL